MKIQTSGKEPPTDTGARVRFRLCDVFLPGSEHLRGFSGDAETEGAIVDFSDSGPKRNAFAVVELDNGQTMVVPVDKLRLVTSD